MSAWTPSHGPASSATVGKPWPVPISPGVRATCSPDSHFAAPGTPKPADRRRRLRPRLPTRPPEPGRRAQAAFASRLTNQRLPLRRRAPLRPPLVCYLITKGGVNLLPLRIRPSGCLTHLLSRPLPIQPLFFLGIQAASPGTTGSRATASRYASRTSASRALIPGSSQRASSRLNATCSRTCRANSASTSE